VSTWNRDNLIYQDDSSQWTVRTGPGVPDGGHDSDFPAVNTAAVVTVPAPPAGKTGIITAICAGYGDTTAKSSISQLTIGAEGIPVVQSVELAMGLGGPIFTAETTVTLPAGAATATGGLFVAWVYV